jgi:hypothetical protein
VCTCHAGFLSLGISYSFRPFPPNRDWPFKGPFFSLIFLCLLLNRPVPTKLAGAIGWSLCLEEGERISKKSAIQSTWCHHLETGSTLPIITSIFNCHSFALSRCELLVAYPCQLLLTLFFL